MRLDKYLCKSTDLSLPEALSLIADERVSVNGELVIKPEFQVHKTNAVSLDGKALTCRPFRYLLLHKPKDMVCSHVDDGYASIFKALNLERKSELHIVGRLDADTTGLVLLTDDGSWTFNIITPQAQCEKRYRVKLSRPIRDAEITKLESGVLLQGLEKPTLPAKVEVIGSHEVYLTLTQGKFHQVKRMFKAVGNRVQKLHREKIGDVSLDVPEGEWRYLREEEVASFY